MEWLADWDNRLELTVDSDRVDQDLADFPALITVASGVGRNGFDASVIFDELTVSDVVFEDDFSSLDGAGWETYAANPADYSNGYMYFDLDSNGERTISTYAYGDYHEIIYKYINRGRGGSDDQFFVYPIFSTGNNYLGTYMRTYSVSDNHLKLQYRFDGGTAVTLHTGQKYNFYNAAISNRATWVKIVRENNILYFKYWPEDLVEPSDWDYIGSFDPTFPTTNNQVYVTGLTNVAEGGARFEYIKITNFSDDNKKSIAVTDSTGINQLPVEIEYWNVRDRQAYLWTKVPTLVSGTDTTMYLYYDKDQLDNDLWVGDTGTVPAVMVWDEYFEAVFHLARAVDSLYIDSSQNNNGVVDTVFTESIDSLHGNMITDASASQYHLTSPGNIGAGDMTLEFIIRVADIDQDDHRTLLSYNDGTGYGNFTIRADSVNEDFDNSIGWSWDSGPGTTSYYHIDKVEMQSATWHYLSSATNSRNTGTKIIVDGTERSPDYSTNNSYPSNSSSYVNIASSMSSDMAEVRISNIQRSDAWMKATYYTLFDNLISYNQGVKPAYYYHGYIKEKSIPVARTVRLYNRESGTLMDETTSSGSNGYYYLTTSISGEHFVAAFDDDAGDSYNAVILDKLQPLGIE